MLPPDYLERMADAIIELYEQFNITVTQDIARRLVQAGVFTESARYQIQIAQQAGALYEDIVRRVAALAGRSGAAVKKLFQEAAVKALRMDDRIYEKAGLKPIPLRQSRGQLDILTAGMQKTGGLLHNLTLTTAIHTQRAYLQAANLAYMQTISGGMDYVTAIKRAVETASQAGSSVVYPSGRTDALAVAVRRSVLTGVNQTTLKLSETHAEEMGCDLVEVSAHGGARPSHAAWQGQIYSRSGKSAKYPPFSVTGYGTGAGLGGWNCRHSFSPYVDGMSRVYSGRELAELNEPNTEYQGQKLTAYEATQRQRAMERAIRASKRELAGYDAARNAAQDPELKTALKQEFGAVSVRLKARQEQLESFLAETGLSRDSSREQVLGFGQSDAARASTSGRTSAVLQKTITTSSGGIVPKGTVLGGVRTIAGGKSSTAFRDARYYAEEYGGDPSQYCKKGGILESKYRQLDIHWVERNGVQCAAKVKGVKEK